jgi:hypothetical protein
MQMKSIIVALVIFGLALPGPVLAQVADSEQEFQQLSAALRAHDGERQAAITTCIKQGIGDNPTGAAKVMGVPVERAAEAWCTRMTNAIAGGRLRLSDVTALNSGTVTPRAKEVLTTASDGK